MLLVVGSFAAIAEGAQGNISKDINVSVSGLENGDKVNFIQVIKWVDGTGWAYVDGLTAAATTAGVTLPPLTNITGQVDISTTPYTVTSGAISAEHAGILAKAAAALPASAIHQENAVSGTATYADAPAGLYYAQVVPGTADYLYNTIFVGADFKSDNATNAIDASNATLAQATGAASAIAKKERVTLTKESMPSTAAAATGADNIKYDHAVGDIVDFKISSTVPAYGLGYVNPHYVITDTIETSGLELCNASGGTAAKTDISVTVGELTMVADTDYVVALTGNTGFTVTLTADGIAKVAQTGVAQPIYVEYKAKITTLDGATVDERKNKATVNFSNKPTDSSSYSLLEDKTRHYTFSIDANVLGQTGYESSELVKIGIDEQGNEITAVTGYDNGTTHGALQNAKFGLYLTQAAAEAAAGDVEVAAADIAHPENNANLWAVQTSDGMGKLNFTGLDAKTYYLVELSAPTGYIKDSAVHTVVITAQYDEIAAGSYKNDDGITVNYDAYKILKTYTITVDGANASTYTFNNQGPVEDRGVKEAKLDEEGHAGDTSTKLKNVKATALPSTGGIGTTLFYIGGGILVLLAVVMLVTKKRMKAED